MFKEQYEGFAARVKGLQGDPHYIALGMGIGVFIAVTPTMPFHTVMALTLAAACKASKAAAILGVWISNPVTVVFLYVACYKTGFLFFDDTTGGLEAIRELVRNLEGEVPYADKVGYFIVFLQQQFKVFVVMNIGGVILGVPSGLAAYFVTRRFFIRRRLKKQQKGKSV